MLPFFSCRFLNLCIIKFKFVTQDKFNNFFIFNSFRIYFNQNAQNCVCSCGVSTDIKTLDVNAIRKSDGDSDVIYDSDEEPPSPPRRSSPTLSYRSNRSKEREQNENRPKAKRVRPKGKLFCCMAMNAAKKHRPTP